MRRKIQHSMVFLVCILDAFVFGVQHDNIVCTNTQKCHCIKLQDGSIKADCSRLQLTSVPNFFGHITIIDLSFNSLSLFHDNAEIPISVVHMDLSNNKLQRFTDASFQNLSNLKTLNLKSNNLSYGSATFIPGLFRGLDKLKKLNLQRNVKERNVPLSEYPVAVTQITSLKRLEIDGIENASFPQSYKNLKHLTHLIMSGFSGNCHLELLQQTLFLHTPFVQHLDLSGCSLRSIDNGTFRTLTQLRYLNISFNKHLTFTSLPGITRDLQYTDINVLDYSKIHCTYGPGTIQYTDDLKPLKNTNLTEIYLDSNRLVAFDADVLLNMPAMLRKISLKDNRLTMGLYAVWTFTMRNLEILDANDQYKSHNPTSDTNRFEFCYDWRGPDKALNERNRRAREITTQTYENHYEGFYDLTRSKRIFNGLLSHSFPNVIVIPLPPKLRTIWFESGTLKYSIPEITFSPNNSVAEIYLRNNVFYSWEGPIHNLHQLVHIDFSQNFCSNLSSIFFNEFPNLEVLNISDNLLGFVFKKHYKIDPFTYLRNLKKLDISLNRIDWLPPNIFRNLRNLNVLNLHSNLLSEWNFSIGHMKKLQLIDLSKNHLTTISKSLRDQIESTVQNSNLTLDLVENLFRCDCSPASQEFIRWVSTVQKQYKLFRNFDLYSCTTFNDTILRFSLLDSYLRELNRECGSHVGLITGVVVAILLSIVCIIGGIGYRYRWKLRYLFYITKSRYLGHSVVRDQGDDKTYKYDAFVSYAEEDSIFVQENLLQAFENDRHFTVCVHQRDFLAGIAVAENITNAVNNSRKTIVILSPNYLKSHWCMFEFNMARMESIYSRDGTSVLILIKYKPVLTKKLSLELLHVMEKQSYIEYPNDPNQGDVAFWESLAASVNK